MFRIRKNRTDVIRFAQSVGNAADVEDLVSIGNRFAAISNVLRSGIGSIKHAESKLAGCAREFASPGRIDDFAGVNRCDHVAVAAGPSKVEQTHSFHEEWAFLREEDGISLIHLDLKRIAFDLAEIRIDGGVQSDGRRDSVFSAQSERRLIAWAVPTVRGTAKLVYRIRDAGEHFEQLRLFQI